MESKDMKDIIEEVKNLAVDAVGKRIQKVSTEDGKELIFVMDEEGEYQYYNPVTHERYDHPDAVIVNTLQGMVDFLTGKAEEYNAYDVFINILNVNAVVAFMKAGGPRNERYQIVRAENNFGNPFQFGQALTQEQFIVQLLTRVEEGEQRDDIFKVVQSLNVLNKDQYDDDGNSTVKKSSNGIYSTSGLDLPQVVNLKPYRTFRDIDQPSSPFLLRYSDAGSPEITLIEADGASWKYQALENIKAFFAEKLPGYQVIG